MKADVLSKKRSANDVGGNNQNAMPNKMQRE